MSKKIRRRLDAAWKAKVALEAVRNEGKCEGSCVTHGIELAAGAWRRIDPENLIDSYPWRGAKSNRKCTVNDSLCALRNGAALGVMAVILFRTAGAFVS